MHVTLTGWGQLLGGLLVEQGGAGVVQGGVLAVGVVLLESMAAQPGTPWVWQGGWLVLGLLLLCSCGCSCAVLCAGALCWCWCWCCCSVLVRVLVFV